ncbi:Myb domain plants domain-containing protein [Dioscorea alata]|uniref:Myb domain plants domain-containing protein n=1 Tax=Dioscorea alata TaxID=55571 RepID=A0ACB7V328_DIOAL|nr:Myb domain plants domain-containing protein [Dioscorea alata]
MSHGGEGPTKKLRKPYTITKARDRWTEEEHERFLDALLLFGRDWKKVEDFVGTKTVIQIRSHAQKYFLKVQKNGILALVPPPRPKRKATHPYLQKAPGHDSEVMDESFVHPHSSSYFIPVYNTWADASLAANYPFPSLDYVTPPPTAEGDKELEIMGGIHNENLSWTRNASISCATYEEPNQDDFRKMHPVIPDLAEVYRFIAGLVDPEIKWPLGVYLHKLKQMDPITVKSILVLVRNLRNNLISPEFELHRSTISAYDVNPKTIRAITGTPLTIPASQMPNCMESNYVGLLPPY